MAVRTDIVIVILVPVVHVREVHAESPCGAGHLIRCSGERHCAGVEVFDVLLHLCNAVAVRVHCYKNGHNLGE